MGLMVESALATREVLYVFTAGNCPACAEALPELEKFVEKHPSLQVLRLDAGGPFPQRIGVKIKATPTYVFRRGEGMASIAGALKASELEKWLRQLDGGSR